MQVYDGGVRVHLGCINTHLVSLLLNGVRSQARLPGLPTVHSLIANGRPGPFHHMNDVSVFLGRQWGEGFVLTKYQAKSMHSRIFWQ